MSDLQTKQIHKEIKSELKAFFIRHDCALLSETGEISIIFNKKDVKAIDFGSVYLDQDNTELQ